MAGYIGSKASVVSSGAENKKVFDITTTTTSLTGLVYTPTLVHVFHNGVRLVDGTDYTATSGTTITLTVAAENGDQVVVISYATFQTSDTVSASAGGTFGNNVSVTGTLAATAVTGDGSGLTSLTSANLTGALPAISGAALTSLSAPNLTGSVPSSAMPAGSVLQVVSVVKTDVFTTTSASLVDITGLSVSITPISATSKILVLCSLSLNVTNGNYMAQAVLFRGATRISVGDAAGSRTQSSAYATINGDRGRSPFSVTFLDSPATTSSTTYKFQGLVETGGTLYINRNASDIDGANNGRTASTITVMEIAE